MFSHFRAAARRQPQVSVHLSALPFFASSLQLSTFIFHFFILFYVIFNLQMKMVIIELLPVAVCTPQRTGRGQFERPFQLKTFEMNQKI